MANYNLLIENAAAKSLVDPIIDIVVPKLPLLFYKNYLYYKCLGFFTDLAAWFTNYFNVLMVSWPNLCKIVIHLFGNVIKIVVFVIGVHGEAPAYVEYVHLFTS